MIPNIAFASAPYAAVIALMDGLEVVRLSDQAHRIEVSIAPSMGNNAFEMKVNGKNILWSPNQTLAQWQEKPVQLGNPFLAPWANRIDGYTFWANNKKYALNKDLGNFRLDGNQQPIHGLLVYAKEWKVIRLTADDNGAVVTSRLEFWRRPDWMAQFPFAHVIDMTYRLKDGSLEVETSIENLSLETMPLSLGYHTYYRLEDTPRDDWTVHVAARDHMILSDKLTPTGEKQPVTLPDTYPIRGVRLDDVFSGLIRDRKSLAEFYVQGRRQKIKVLFGPKYDVAIVFSPQDRDFVCFEPMVGLTNAFNMAHAGTFRDLQSIPPAGTWKESFWIVPEGF
jgi:aldose 1-epimerase